MSESELIDELLDDAKGRMAKSVEATKNEFATVRTGRASPALLDRVHVDYDAAEAAGEHLGARGANADRDALRQELDQGDREVDHGVRPGPDTRQRRHRHPPDDSRADRG